MSPARARAFEHRTNDGFDPDIPFVSVLEWSDGALLDRVCAAIYDAELRLDIIAQEGDMPDVLLIVHRVMERVWARGLRTQDTTERENWTGVLPGMQGQHLETERSTLCFVADSLYQNRQRLVREVVPKLPLARALALADALVIAETDMVREGMVIDPMLDDKFTPLQWCSNHLRWSWLVARSSALESMSEDLPSDVIAWAKGGAR